MVKMDNVIQQKILETINNIRRKNLNAKFVAMKDKIYELKLEVKSLKEGIEKIDSKSSPDKNYKQELNIILF